MSASGQIRNAPWAEECVQACLRKKRSERSRCSKILQEVGRMKLLIEYRTARFA